MPIELADHGRYAYRAITDRPEFSWPHGKRLAVYIGLNLEHFAFGEGHGAALVAGRREPDVLNYAWRDYGNRVGAWRLLDAFAALDLPVSLIANSAIADYCPALIEAYAARLETEVIAHGRSNSESQNELDATAEAELIRESRDALTAGFGVPPAGWLGPWIAQSRITPDLLADAGFDYLLDWCHDDQPVWMATRNGQPILSVPYPQELNDIPSVAVRRADYREFADMIVDCFDEMREQSEQQALVMGIALHPYIVGQPFRLRALRRALQHLAAPRGDVWLTTPGTIAAHFRALFPA